MQIIRICSIFSSFINLEIRPHEAKLAREAREKYWGFRFEYVMGFVRAWEDFLGF
jgi:hypothetical protein